MAKVYLTIPATSAPAERTSSKTGHKRSSLASENIDPFLIFLTENKQLSEK